MPPRRTFGAQSRWRAERRDRESESEAKDEPTLPSLEEVIIALQKSLARSQRDALERSRAERGFVEGQQPLYVVDALDVDLNVGVRAATEEGDKAPQRMLLDFDAEPDQRSSIKLRVQVRPLEAMTDDIERLFLADLDLDRRVWPRRRLMASYVGPERPALKVELVLKDEEAEWRVAFPLNDLRQQELTIDPESNTVAIGTEQPRRLEGIRLDDKCQFFAWLECPSATEKKTLRSRLIHTLGEEEE